MVPQRTLFACERKLVGPQLAAFEVSGAFIRALRRNDIDEAMCISNCNRWLETIRSNVMQLSFDQADILRGTSIATKLDHPLADCIYLGMAERLEGNFVTADEVFYKKVKKKFSEIKFIKNVVDLMPQEEVGS